MCSAFFTVYDVWFLFYCLPSHPFAGALIKRIIYPDLKMDNAWSSQPEVNCDPKSSPLGRDGLPQVPTSLIIDGQIPVCTRHVCAL